MPVLGVLVFKWSKATVKRDLASTVCTHVQSKQLQRRYASLTFFVLQQQQNLGQRFGTSEMHLSTQVALAAVRSKAVVLLLLIRV